MKIHFSNYSYLYSFYADYEAYDSAIVLDTLSVNFKAYFQVYCLRVQDYCCFLFIFFLYIFEYGRVIYIWYYIYWYIYNIAVYISFCVLLNCCHISPKLPYQGSETLAHVHKGKSMIEKRGNSKRRRSEFLINLLQLARLFGYTYFAI